MKENVKMNNFVEVRSLSLLKEFSKAKCLGSLVRIEEDKHDPACRPVYKFADKDDVRAVVKQFIDTYSADDRSMDDWSSFNAAQFRACEDTIVTRNFRIVNQIIEAGWGMNLCGVFKDPNSHKKTFTFLANDEIKQIKTEGDAASNAWYAEKIKDGGKNE